MPNCIHQTSDTAMDFRSVNSQFWHQIFVNLGKWRLWLISPAWWRWYQINRVNCSSRTSQNGHQPFQITSLSPKSSLRIKKQIALDQQTKTDGSTSEESVVEAPEVFLGGSCNPTTWRADVAMPELKKLGISFYNPVSFWIWVSEAFPLMIFLVYSKSHNGRLIS